MFSGLEPEKVGAGGGRERHISACCFVEGILREKVLPIGTRNAPGARPLLSRGPAPRADDRVARRRAAGGRLHARLAPAVLRSRGAVAALTPAVPLSPPPCSKQQNQQHQSEL